MIWLTEWATFLIALAVVFVPGAIAAVVLGMRGFSVIALAGPLSIAGIAAASLVNVVVPFAWGPVGWGISAVGLIVAALIIRIVQQRWNGRWRESAPAGKWSTWLPIIVVVVAAAVCVPRLLFIFHAPENISQTFDNVYHLNAVRYALDTGEIAPTKQLIPGFYPSLWHAVTATVAELSGATVPAAVNVTSAVLGGIVWPIGCVWLVRQITGDKAAALVTAGALAVGLGAFPILMVDFGVLYPNVLSIALLPSVMAALIAVAGLGEGTRPATVTRWVIVLALVPTLALAHPSTLMAFFAIGIWPAAAGGIRFFHTARAQHVPVWGRILAALAWIGGLAIATALLWYARPTREQAFWPPSRSFPDAIIEALTNGTVGRPWAWIPSIAVVIGIIVVLGWQRRRWWLVAGWATMAILYVVCAAAPAGTIRYRLSGTWYSDLYRLAALMPAVVVPLGAVGVAGLVGVISHARWRAVATAVTAAVVLVGTQAGAAMGVATDAARYSYALTDDSPLLTVNERALIDRLDAVVPEDDVITGSPWTGASLSYALANRRALVPHIYSDLNGNLNADARTILDSLNEADRDPVVCPAVERLKAYWVLDFGTREVHGDFHPYAGLENLADSGVVTLVDSEGPDAKLYRVTACD